MKLVTTFVAALLATRASIAGMQAIDLSRCTIVDLSHTDGPSTVFVDLARQTTRVWGP